MAIRGGKSKRSSGIKRTTVRTGRRTTTSSGRTSKRGFASMSKAKVREIASKGGRSVPAAHRSFSQNHALAVRAGRKGGRA